MQPIHTQSPAQGAENRPAPVANAGYAPTYDGFDVKGYLGAGGDEFCDFGKVDPEELDVDQNGHYSLRKVDQLKPRPDQEKNN